MKRFVEGRYKENEEVHITLDRVKFTSIASEDNVRIILTFPKEEIKGMV